MNDKQKLMESLEAGRAVFLDALAGVTEDLASQDAGPGRWSILQCVEHVAVAEEYLLGEIATASPSDKPLLNEKREAAILERGPDRSRRVEAPDVAKPTGRFLTLSEALQQFLSARQNTIRFLEDSNQNLRSLLTRHPVIGTVNCYENLLMMAVHPQRHAKQIDEIREVLGRSRTQ